MAGFPELDELSLGVDLPKLEMALPPFPVLGPAFLAPIMGEVPRPPASFEAIFESLGRFQTAAGTVAHHQETATQQRRSVADAGRESWIGPDGVAFGARMDDFDARMAAMGGAIRQTRDALAAFAQQLQDAYVPGCAQMEGLNAAMGGASATMAEGFAVRNANIMEAMALDASVVASEASAPFWEAAQVAHEAAAAANQSRIELYQQQEALKQRVHEQYATALAAVDGGLSAAHAALQTSAATFLPVDQLAASTSGIPAGFRFFTSAVAGSQVLGALPPGMQQVELSSCGPAAAAQACQQLGVQVSQAQVALRARPTLAGTRPDDLAAAMNGILGSSIYSSRVAPTPSGLEQALAGGRPAVAWMRFQMPYEDGSGARAFQHYMTVERIDGGWVYYSDPWSGLAGRAPVQSFLAECKGVVGAF